MRQLLSIGFILLSLGLFAQDRVTVVNTDVTRNSRAIDTLILNDLVLEGRLDSLETDTLYFAGGTKVYYDAGSYTNASTTGIPGVIVQIGQELHYIVINNSGSTILNGTSVYTSSVDLTVNLIEILEADAASAFTSLSTIGLVTADIEDGEIGLVTFFGIVRDYNTIGLTPGRPFYVASGTGQTSTKPLSPNAIVVLGTILKEHATEGRAWVTINRFTRPLVNGSYSFTSNGVISGLYYVAGFYESPLLDANLTQASLTQTLGSAGNAYAAHAFMVAGGAGSVDAGQVGLRVIGNSITDLGVNTAVDTTVITTDITTLSTDEYLETTTKWLGTSTYELYIVSGSPTTYSFDFNYGYAKYEDFGNKDYTVNVFEAVGTAGANDTNFDLELLHHHPSGWTYAAAGFIPGNGAIVQWSTTMAPNDNLVNNENVTFKRSGLAQYIDGSGAEGVVVRITAGASNSLQTINVHITGEIESF